MSSSSTETQVKQILDNISQLQQTEQQLYTELEASIQSSAAASASPVIAPAVTPTTYYIYGPSVGDGHTPVPIINTASMGDQTVYIIQDGQYTKMVQWPSNISKYYTGTVANFSTSNWDTYSNMPPGNYLLTPTPTAPDASTTLNEYRQWCVTARNTYGVIPYETWGTMNTSDLQTQWTNWNCNVNSNPPPPPPPPPPTAAQNAGGTWQYQGCYNDTQTRALSNDAGQVNSVDACQQIAYDRGDIYVGLQYGGQCFTGPATDNPTKYGVQTNASQCSNPLGTAWTNMLYKYIITPPATTPVLSASSQQLISRINQLSSIRMSLYENLNYIYNTVQQSSSQSTVSLANLKKSVDYAENALNQTKDRFNELNTSKDNKMRMVEINTYYGKWYKAQARVIKICVFILAIIIILLIIRRKGILNANIINIIIAVIITVGAYILLAKYVDISSRNNMNFDVYDWGGMGSIPKNTPNTNNISTTGLTDDIKKSFAASFEGIGVCVGDGCCSSGMKYDQTLRKCLDSSSTETFTSNRLITNVHNKNHKKNSSVEVPVAIAGNQNSVSHVKHGNKIQ